MSMMASQITSLTIVCSTVYSGADGRKHHIAASLAFVWEFTSDRWHKRPVTRKIFPFDDFIMDIQLHTIHANTFFHWSSQNNGTVFRYASLRFWRHDLFLPVWNVMQLNTGQCHDIVGISKGIASIILQFKIKVIKFIIADIWFVE